MDYMGNNNYARGAAFERKVKDYLESRGYFAGRSAGSHGLTDVFAVSPNGTPIFIQCKTGKAKMSYKDRKTLYDMAVRYQADAYVASPDGTDILFQWITFDGDLSEGATL